MKKRFTKVIVAMMLLVAAVCVVGCNKPDEPNNGGNNGGNGGGEIIGNAPEGCIDGKFTINEHGGQVYFSKGNLQYRPSTNTWHFANHQYEMCVESVDSHYFMIEDRYGLCSGVMCWYHYWGPDTEITEDEYNTIVANHPNDYVMSHVEIQRYVDALSHYTSSYSGWIDLFAWGTSGFDHGATCYQPWCYEYVDEKSYYAYGEKTCNLYDKTGHADWGYNSISNGGDRINYWRTLTKEEWEYVLFTRHTLMGSRFAKAQVNEINGVVLFPDDWDNSNYMPNNPNLDNSNYESNKINISLWTNLERNGAVFLPAAGKRHYYNHNISEYYDESNCFQFEENGLRILGVGEGGGYWTSSYDYGYYTGSGDVCHLTFGNGFLQLTQYGVNRGDGRSVRLVCPVEN